MNREEAVYYVRIEILAKIAGWGGVCASVHLGNAALEAKPTMIAPPGRRKSRLETAFSVSTIASLTLSV